MAETKGLEDLRVAVEELTADLRKKVVIGALKDAAKPIIKAAQAVVPVRTGLVRKNIASFTSKLQKGQNGVIGVYVTVRKNKGVRVKGTKVRIKVLGQDPFYWKFLELGTKKMAARPFLRPAAEANFQQSIEIFSKAIKTRIDKANKRKPG